MLDRVRHCICRAEAHTCMLQYDILEKAMMCGSRWSLKCQGLPSLIETGW